MTRADCNADGCTQPRVGRGLCQMHYGRWRRKGQIDGEVRTVTHRDAVLTELRIRRMRGERAVWSDPRRPMHTAMAQLSQAVGRRLDDRWVNISSAVQIMEKRGELRIARHPHRTAYVAIALTPAGLRAAREVEVQQHLALAESQR